MVRFNLTSNALFPATPTNGICYGQLLFLYLPLKGAAGVTTGINRICCSKCSNLERTYNLQLIYFLLDCISGDWFRHLHNVVCLPGISG